MAQSKGTVLHILSGDLWGGAEAQMWHQLKALRELGWNVQLLFFNNLETLERFEDAGFQCHIIEESQGILRLLRQAKTTFDCLDPDIVVAHGYKQTFLAWRLTKVRGIPWIATFHGFTENDTGFAGLRMRIYQALQMRLVNRHAKRAIVVSEKLAEQLAFPPSTQVEVVPNVFAADTESPSLEKKEKLFEQKPAIAIVGRLVPVKRIDRAISAFAEMLIQSKSKRAKKAHLYIIGDGPERERLESQVADYDLDSKVHFLGFQDAADKYIAKADLLLISSDSEGIPTVLLEAIAYGTPVVSTNVGGISEVFEKLPDYPFELVEKEVRTVSTALGRLIRKRGLRKKAAACLESFQQHFSPKVAAASHERIYLEVMDHWIKEG